MRGLIPLLLFTACGSSNLPSDAGSDASLDAAIALDASPDAFRPRTHETLPPPEALVAGVAEVRIPAPVGVGTMGFGAVGVDPSETPFSDTFPGTTRSHGTLTFRAVALSRGPAHEVVLVRMDTVGVFQQLREAVLDELETRLGRRLDDALILAGNHTHSGPGRILMTTGALTLLGDTFFPELYDRIVGALADVIELAIQDQRPAELGHAIATTSEGHSDRRCENDPLPQVQEVPDLPLVAVRREGRLDAIIASYAYHGTVLGIDEHTLSGDMGGVVEQKIEERFDHPVLVLFFNSWGADMAPGNPPIDPGAVGADQPGGYDRMDRVGDVIAGAVMPALGTITFSSTPELRARTYRVRLDREVIGYASGEFGYPNGGAFCGLGSEGVCDRIAPIADLDTRCVRISPRENLPKQTILTAGRIGTLHFVTAPGEWSTSLSAGVLDHVRSQSGEDAMLIGYANDYTGYSVQEQDWWQGGYEASGALWGPRQGEYLGARLREAFDTYFDLWVEPPWLEPARVEPFGGYSYTPYVPERGLMVGTLASDVPASAGPTDVVAFTVRGEDPWLGVPVATLERETGGSFTGVLRSTGEPVDSTSYDFWIDLVPTPSYAGTPRAAERTFEWQFHFPIARRVAASRPSPR